MVNELWVKQNDRQIKCFVGARYREQRIACQNLIKQNNWFLISNAIFNQLRIKP